VTACCQDGVLRLLDISGDEVRVAIIHPLDMCVCAFAFNFNYHKVTFGTPEVSSPCLAIQLKHTALIQ
jgi:hypothetical protein